MPRTVNALKSVSAMEFVAAGVVIASPRGAARRARSRRNAGRSSWRRTVSLEYYWLTTARLPVKDIPYPSMIQVVLPYVAIDTNLRMYSVPLASGTPKSCPAPERPLGLFYPNQLRQS